MRSVRAMSSMRQPANESAHCSHIARNDALLAPKSQDVHAGEPLSAHIALGSSPEKARETGKIPSGIPDPSPGGIPVGPAPGMALGEALGMPLGSALGPSLGTDIGGASDWSLWWGTFQTMAHARLHVWRCSATGLNIGEALIVMTVEDARRMRLDDHATALGYLSGRFGPGRFRLTPRSDQGTKLPGTQSLIAIIDEDTAMQVTMNPSAAPTITSMPVAPVDRETAIEIERMRLQAETERDRDARRERQREQREERRREREQERERRRQEDRVRRDEDDRRRSERDAQTQTMLMQVLKEMAVGRSAATADPLVAAALAKLGQPDPLVLKLLDSHGKREELTDFFKIQAESMRMASSLQTDSLKQVMVASQDVQSHLIRQAAEVATQREGGDWNGIGSALAATASIIAALRGSPPVGVTGDQVVLDQPAHHSLDQRVTTAPPHPVSTTTPTSGLAAWVHGLRAMQRGETADTEVHLRQLMQRLPPDLADAIVRGDATRIQQALLPIVHSDPVLAKWLGAPGVSAWLVTCFQRAQVLMTPTPSPDTDVAVPSRRDDDAIV